MGASWHLTTSLLPHNFLSALQVHPQLTMQMGLQGMQPMGLVGLPAQWGPHMQAAAAAGYSLPSLAAAAAAMQSMYGPPSPQQQQQLMLSMAGGPCPDRAA